MKISKCFLFAVLFILAGCGSSKPFLQSASEGKLKEVQNALSSGVDINVQDAENGYTALHLAVSNDHKLIVKLLVEKGAEVNKLNFRKQTALDLSTTESTDKFLRKHGGKSANELTVSD